MSEKIFERSQWIARPLSEVFPFFQRPENLEKLTPPDLGFEILTPKPIEMRAGARIDYTVRPFGVPARWQTLIETYEPPRRFTDLQTRGPYALWHHTHLFVEENGGTRMTDVVRYRLPMGPFGNLAAPLVRRELERIFDFRKDAVDAIFPAAGGKTMNIVLAGGSGFIGRHLARLLVGAGHGVTVLTRGGKPDAPGTKSVAWSGDSTGAWERAIDGCDAVVNLSGAGVADWLWTRAYRERLVSSRLRSTRALIDAMARAAVKPKVFVNASAVGFYGDRGEEMLDEGAPQGRGFLADLCRSWEEEASRAESLGVRTVIARIGVVLGRDGGALPKMLPAFRLVLGGRLGSGRQWMPWIHVADAAGMIAAAIDDAAYRGVMNVVAPEAARNADFTRALGAALGRPTPFPVPAPILRIGLGEMSTILLAGQRVKPGAALAKGYRFRFPEIGSALRDLARS